MSFHSKFQSGGVLSLIAMHCAVQGLTGALPGNATLAPTGAAIATTTLGDGRTAWRFPAGGTSQLTSGAQTIANFYGGAAMCRFVWQGYNAGQNDCRLLQIGNLMYLSVTGGVIGVASINGQTINMQNLGSALTIGVEYCVIINVDYSNLLCTVYINGTSVGTTALVGWTGNVAMSTTVTAGDATGRGAADIIEFGWYNGSQTASALTNTHIATISGASYFLDILRPTHPATSPMTYTSQIVGGRLTDVHTVSLRQSSDPINDAGTIVATGNRTGPGAISIADPATDTSGRKFYRLEVSSTGSITMTSTNYGSGAPGGFVLGCAPPPTPPTAAAFSAIPSCPAMGGVADSRGLAQANNNGPYRILRGGTTDNFVGIVAPGAGWKHYNGTPYSGTLYKANGTTQTLTNTDLMAAYLAEAAVAGITVTNFGPLGVNDWVLPGTDTTLRADISGAITRARNAGHRVVITQEIGNEFSPQSQSNLISQSAYIATLADGVNIIQSDDAYQRFNAANLDMVSLDGTHAYGTGALNLNGNPINGMTAAQITANYNFLALQTAILPGVQLTINNAVGTIEPGATLQRTLTVRPVNSFTGSCSLAVTGLPTGVTATFSPTSPLTISGGSAITVTMTLTAAADAPLTGSAASVTVTATAATSTPSVVLSLSVVDVTPPSITSVVIDTNGTSVTITTDSLVTGNTGVSVLEGGSLRAFIGNLTTTDNLHFTGTLATACSAGTTCTWSYNPSTGNMIDAGSNEIPSSSGSATNNTSGGGSGGGGTGGSNLLMEGVRRFVTGLDCECEDTIFVTPGDKFPVRGWLRDGKKTLPAGDVSGLSAYLTSLDGTVLVPSLAVTVVTEDEGRVNVQLDSTANGFPAAGSAYLRVKRTVTSTNIVIFTAKVRIS